MASRGSSQETQDTEAAKLAARILHRKLQRASIERPNQLKFIHVEPSKETQMVIQYPKSFGFATAIIHTIFQVEAVGNDRLNRKLPTTKLFNQLTYKIKASPPCSLVHHSMWY